MFHAQQAILDISQCINVSVVKYQYSEYPDSFRPFPFFLPPVENRLSFHTQESNTNREKEQQHIHVPIMQAIRLQKKYPEFKQEEMMDLINQFK